VIEPAKPVDPSELGSGRRIAMDIFLGAVAEVVNDMRVKHWNAPTWKQVLLFPYVSWKSLRARPPRDPDGWIPRQRLTRETNR
jgi:hypothetical protein